MIALFLGFNTTSATFVKMSRRLIRMFRNLSKNGYFRLEGRVFHSMLMAVRNLTIFTDE